MKSIVFGERTVKEILRDPLSYIFCLGFPIVMLLIMTIVNKGIPPEAGMALFKIQHLAPGIAVFGITFVMLFACLQLSKDRSTAFLARLYATPMGPVDFIAGYTLPLMALAILQTVITLGASTIVGAATGYTFQVQNLLLCLVVLIPTELLFIAFGMLFGALLNEKAAPGVCSILITVASILGGIWMDVDMLGGVLKDLCHALPFYQGVKAARMALQGEISGMATPLLIILGYALLTYVLAVLVMRNRMQRDVR